MAQRKHRWIKSAINPEHSGQFRAKAQHAGESTRQYAEEHKGDDGATGKQARLAINLMGLHHGPERRYSKMKD